MIMNRGRRSEGGLCGEDGDKRSVEGVSQGIWLQGYEGEGLRGKLSETDVHL